MTQPPDDRERKPDGTAPDDPTAPENQPTVAWTSPYAQPSPDAQPLDATPDAQPLDATPTEPQAPPPPDASPAGEPPPDAYDPPATPAATPWEAAPPPASPIISASPSVAPDAPGVTPLPAGPVVGWAAPPPAAAAPGREGYVIAGMGARLVAYLLDAVLVTIVPTILMIFVLDYGSVFDQMIEAMRAGAATGAPTQTNFVMEVTPELILVTLISLAIQFIYFVGFWTSGGRATPGMRGLRMQVVDAATGGTLSLTAATKRFVAMGSLLGLLVVLPALQSAASILPFGVSLFLFFTAITNDRRQGLHDKWASSLVIRSTTSGDGATLVGCLALIVIVVGVGIVLSLAFFAAVGPQLEDLLREMENTI